MSSNVDGRELRKMLTFRYVAKLLQSLPDARQVGADYQLAVEAGQNFCNSASPSQGMSDDPRGATDYTHAALVY